MRRRWKTVEMYVNKLLVSIIIALSMQLTPETELKSVFSCRLFIPNTSSVLEFTFKLIHVLIA